MLLCLFFICISFVLLLSFFYLLHHFFQPFLVGVKIFYMCKISFVMSWKFSFKLNFRWCIFWRKSDLLQSLQTKKWFDAFFSQNVHAVLISNSFCLLMTFETFISFSQTNVHHWLRHIRKTAGHQSKYVRRSNKWKKKHLCKKQSTNLYRMIK